MANAKPKTPAKTPAVTPAKPQTPPAQPAPKPSAPKPAPSKKASTLKEEKTHARVAPTPKAETRRHWDEEDLDADLDDDEP